MSALFAGPSGTGKTMAAEVLARDFGRNLYRIDLDTVVSKYIGETEKNLAELFGSAKAHDAILLFDEADSLFGKRTEVKGFHDRYANLEMGYLLQRIETYGGLVILGINKKRNLDEAFIRRLRFVVDFPFPNAALRARIWCRILPEASVPNASDIVALAALKVIGGTIRRIATAAAFIAARAGEPLRVGQSKGDCGCWKPQLARHGTHVAYFLAPAEWR